MLKKKCEVRRSNTLYILNMFPYPSGDGLHVGHPLGYVASDIFARYKKMQGFKVINPMGFDSFGLPAEQYAILTGQHPAITTERNIKHFITQLNNIDLDFDWDRMVKTSDPSYYKWTQWIFIQMFNSFYCTLDNKAHRIEDLYAYFSKNGTKELKDYVFFKESKYEFTAEEWNSFSNDKKYKISLDFRIAYLDNIEVNWCDGLKTVLANDEVKNGLSERGGYPVIRKKMKQWALRISAFADRLLEDLNHLPWPESTKEIQRNWIGKSQGANIYFKVDGLDYIITIFTSRPETIFGVTFLALSKDHEFVKKYCSNINLGNLKDTFSYKEKVESITGEETGYFAINPINNEQIPIFVVNYVLQEYGTGAIMGVPELDDRDKDFWKSYNFSHYYLPAHKEEKDHDALFDEYVKGEYLKISKHVFEKGHFVNSDFLNGLGIDEAKETILKTIKENGIGEPTTCYRLKDAIFSRQRYWGEPIPIYYKEVNVDGKIEKMPFTVNEKDLPLELPNIDDFKPTGEAPLKRAKNWTYKGYELEVNTMPGWAGSSWYFLRYLDPNNDKEFCSKDKLKEFGNVDLYLGGAEHAVGHLLYSRFYTKFLYDLGYINFEEPFKKLIHQGMILGESAITYRINGTNKYISYLKDNEVEYHHKNDDNKNIENTDKRSINSKYLKLMNEKGVTPIHIPISFIDTEDYTGNEYDDIFCNLDKLRKWRPDFKDAEFLLGDGYTIDQDGKRNRQYLFFKVKRIIEKMSKSKYNVVNPDDVIGKYGSDVFRMYLMFLGPIEQQKPWNTKRIEGIVRFLNKVNNITSKVCEKAQDDKELKSINKCIRDVGNNIENFSFNTAISSLMICLNELSELKSISKDVFRDYLLLLKPFAPQTANKLWEKVFKRSFLTCIFKKKFWRNLFKNGFRKGFSQEDVLNEMAFPSANEEYLTENTIQYPVMINGKVRTQIVVNKGTTDEQIKDIVLKNDIVINWIKGQKIKNFIIVKEKIISIATIVL